MKPPIPRSLTAWGRSSASVSTLWHVECADDIARCMQSAGRRGTISRGLGRSYGDACLNDGGDVLDLTSLSSIDSFDRESGVLRCAAGASFRTVGDHCLPLGWFPPVCPGTAFVSMGGAIANDVHGKNQHIDGSFGDHVDWIDLRLPDGSLKRISAGTDAELFAATVGGIGLTGVIESVQLRLRPAPSNAIDLKQVSIPDLETFLDLLESNRDEYPYSVGWIDALAKGAKLGRGILELARPSSENVATRSGLTVNVPFNAPQFLLNRYSVRAFNAAYFAHVPTSGRETRIHLNKFLFPLDAIGSWNRLYGRRGVFQFQCVIPFNSGRRAIAELLERTVRSEAASFLAVLKAMGKVGKGMLSFSRPGFTLALDFPRRRETKQLIDELHEIVLKYDGRIYLAKDACLQPTQFEAMYPESLRFKALLRTIDPKQVMQSDMARRLNLTQR